MLISVLLFGLELIILGWALATGIVGRMVVGRPWVVEASMHETPAHMSERAVGETAAALGADRALPPAVRQREVVEGA